jgi:hypothetical protein
VTDGMGWEWRLKAKRVAELGEGVEAAHRMGWEWRVRIAQHMVNGRRFGMGVEAWAVFSRRNGRRFGMGVEGAGRHPLRPLPPLSKQHIEWDGSGGKEPQRG